MKRFLITKNTVSDKNNYDMMKDMFYLAQRLRDRDESHKLKHLTKLKLKTKINLI